MDNLRKNQNQTVNGSNVNRRISINPHCDHYFFVVLSVSTQIMDIEIVTTSTRNQARLNLMAQKIMFVHVDLAKVFSTQFVDDR